MHPGNIKYMLYPSIGFFLSFVFVPLATGRDPEKLILYQAIMPFVNSFVFLPPAFISAVLRNRGYKQVSLKITKGLEKDDHVVKERRGGLVARRVKKISSVSKFMIVNVRKKVEETTEGTTRTTETHGQGNLLESVRSIAASFTMSSQDFEGDGSFRLPDLQHALADSLQRRMPMPEGARFVRSKGRGKTYHLKTYVKDEAKDEASAEEGSYIVFNAETGRLDEGSEHGLEVEFHDLEWWWPWSVRHLRGPQKWDFVTDSVGQLCLVCSTVPPVYYVAIDTVYVATGNAGQVALLLRPVISMVLKSQCYKMWIFGTKRCGLSMCAWGMWFMYLCLAVNQVAAAVQCRTWGAVGSFVVCDALSFAWKLFNCTDRYDRMAKKAAAELRRLEKEDLRWSKNWFVYGAQNLVLSKTKPETPDDAEDTHWWAYDLAVETAMSSVCYVAIIGMYKISHMGVNSEWVHFWIGENEGREMLNHLLFPVDDSIWYAVCLGVLELFEFTLVILYTLHYFGDKLAILRADKVFGSGGLMVTLSVGVCLWAPWALITLGWTFEYRKVGPFGEDVLH